MEGWKITEIVSEVEQIQKRLTSSKRSEEAKERGFVRLMLEGKVSKALKLVDAGSEISGVHKLTEEIRDQLNEKHPLGSEADPDVLDPRSQPRVEEVIFEDINGEAVQAAARKISGSGGATKIDADIWKHMICSKGFGNFSDNLANEIAKLIRRVCTEKIH